MIMLQIGDFVKDEDNCFGIVGIYYDDGDFVVTENDAAHPSPQICEGKEARQLLIDRRNQPKKQSFDEFWLKNRTKLLAVYNEEINISLAVMDIAEFAWKAGCNAK